MRVHQSKLATEKIIQKSNCGITADKIGSLIEQQSGIFNL